MLLVTGFSGQCIDSSFNAYSDVAEDASVLVWHVGNCSRADRRNIPEDESLVSFIS